MLLTSFNSLTLFEFTEPPYKTLWFFNFFFINLTVCSKSLFFGTKPVPMDQTGSYAIKISFLFLIFLKPNLIDYLESF